MRSYKAGAAITTLLWDWMSNVDSALQSRGQWFGGICTTQRCEGMNHTFKLEVGKYTTLNDFIPRYQRGICRMRDRVLLDNFKSRNHCREYKTHMSSMEEFVFNTFTDDIYLVIRNQIDFEKKFRVSSRFPDWDSNNLMLYVTQYDKEDRRWAVQYIACSSEKEEDETYSCSCQLFESDGIPCAHIFCVMKSEGVRHYPKSLICPRWKKSNGRRPVQMTCAEDEGSGFKPSRYLTLIAAAKRACYNLASTQEGFKKGIAAMNKLEEESFEFRVPKKPRRMVGDNDNVVRDPKVAQTKGTHWNTENGNKTNGDHVNKCRTCKQPGHNKRSCPNKHLFTEKEGEDRPDPPLSQSSYGIQKCLTLGADNRAPASCHPPSIPEHNGLNNLNQELPDMNSQVSDSGEPLLDHSLWAGH